MDKGLSLAASVMLVLAQGVIMLLLRGCWPRAGSREGSGPSAWRLAPS